MLVSVFIKAADFLKQPSKCESLDIAFHYDMYKYITNKAFDKGLKKILQIN